MKQESTAQTFSTIYEGFSGFKTAFQKVIDDCPMGGTINIIGFSEEQYNVDSLRVFLRNMNLRAKQKKQKLRILLPISTQYTLGKDREKEPNTEVRYLVDGFVSPAAVDIVEDSVYTFLWDQKPYVFAIKNKKIADSYRSYFNSLWKQAKEN